MNKKDAQKFRTHTGLWVILALSALFGSCTGKEDPPANPPLAVLVERIGLSDYSQRSRISGEIRARTEGDLSFQIAGKVTERTAEVGDRVAQGQVLAQLDPAEKQADVKTAEADVRAAEAVLRQATSSFQRQQSLLEGRVATRKDYDSAQETLRTAQASLDVSKTQLETAREELGYTILRAPAAGVVTASNMEVGRVVQAAEAVYTIAEDGPRDAVFDVDEATFASSDIVPEIAVSLISDPSVKARAEIREVSPTVDRTTGTIRVKVEIKDIPPEMTLGAAVIGEASFPTRKVMVIPSDALFSLAGKPALWTVNPETGKVALKTIAIQSYESGRIIIESGIASGETVVTRGGQLLHPDQTVKAIERTGE